jgi:hypothetical protein
VFYSHYCRSSGLWLPEEHSLLTAAHLSSFVVSLWPAAVRLPHCGFSGGGGIVGWWIKRLRLASNCRF